MTFLTETFKFFNTLNIFAGLGMLMGSISPAAPLWIMGLGIALIVSGLTLPSNF